MLHDVTISVYDAVTRSGRVEVIKVDADGGDDAVAQAKVRAAEHGAFRIVSVYPSAPEAAQSPDAAVEGADAQDAEADERAALLSQAIDQGIAVDRRWGVARLRAAIEAANAPAEAAE